MGHLAYYTREPFYHIVSLLLSNLHLILEWTKKLRERLFLAFRPFQVYTLAQKSNFWHPKNLCQKFQEMLPQRNRNFNVCCHKKSFKNWKIGKNVHKHHLATFLEFAYFSDKIDFCETVCEVYSVKKASRFFGV